MDGLPERKQGKPTARTSVSRDTALNDFGIVRDDQLCAIVWKKCKFVVWDGYVWSRANQSGHSIPKAWFSRFNLVSTIRCGEKVLFTVKQALHQARSCFENGIETVVTFLLRVLMYYPNWRKWKEYGSYHLQSSPLVQALIIEPGK